MRDQITPLILTYNEAPNIGRTLEQLRWAHEIVVVDSFSTDQTLEIVSQFPQVRVFQRVFDDFVSQWDFGLKQTGISTDWVLAIDADFVLTSGLVDELNSLEPEPNIHGYQVSITFCVNGRPLRSSLLPALPVLYRRQSATYLQDGHTQHVLVSGAVSKLHFEILHDDRKTFNRWFESQRQYMALEAKKLLRTNSSNLNVPDKVRCLRLIAPIVMPWYCLLIRRGILDGWPGFYYAFQRTFAELILSLYLIEADLRSVSLRIKRRKNLALGKEPVSGSNPN